MTSLRPDLCVRACLLVLAISACGGDDASPGGAGADAGDGAAPVTGGGVTGAAAEATARCIDTCDHEIEADCSGTTASWRRFCVSGCERTTQQTLPDCIDELLVLQQCRAALAWECDGFGMFQPTSSCAAESGACLQCMGGVCDALVPH